MLRSLIILTLILCSLAVSAGAQQPEPPFAPEGLPPMVGQGPGPEGPPPNGPPGAPNGPGGPEGQHRRPVTPEMEARFLAFLKQTDPSSAEDLAKLKTQNPAQYQHVVADGIGRMHMAEMLQKKDPAAYQDIIAEMRLESGVRRLAEKYKDAPAAQKAALKDQLRAQLSQLFDVREQNRKRQIERLEKDLARMKSTLEARAKGKSAIVNRRLDEMLADPTTSW